MLQGCLNKKNSTLLIRHKKKQKKPFQTSKQKKSPESAGRSAMTSVLEAATTYLFHSSKYKLSDSLNPSTYTCLLSNQKGKKELIYLAYVQQLRSLHTNQSPLNVPAHAAPITLTHKELPIWTNILHFVGYFRLTHLLFFACCIKRKRKKKLNSPRQPNERFLPPAFLSLKQIRTPSAASRSACCKIVEACSLAHIRRRTLRSTLGRDSPRGHGVQLPQYVRMSICLTYDFSAVVYCCVFLFFFSKQACVLYTRQPAATKTCGLGQSLPSCGRRDYSSRLASGDARSTPSSAVSWRP